MKTRKNKGIEVDALREASIPRRYWNKGLNYYYGCDKALKSVTKYLDKFSHAFSSGTGILFTGESESGKTFLICYALQFLLRTGTPVRYLTQKKMVDAYVMGEFDALVTMPVLALDQFEAPIHDIWKQATWKVLHARQDYGNPTLIATDMPLSKTEVTSINSNYGPKVFNHIKRNFIHVSCEVSETIREIKAAERRSILTVD
jgi:DNA replication protein DnaC